MKERSGKFSFRRLYHPRKLHSENNVKRQIFWGISFELNDCLVIVMNLRFVNCLIFLFPKQSRLEPMLFTSAHNLLALFSQNNQPCFGLSLQVA
jgi:hypothetical protein